MGILISSYKAPYEPTSTMKCHKGLITAHLFISEESFNKNNSPSLGWNFDPQERFRRVSHVFSIFNSIYIYIFFFHESTIFFEWVWSINFKSRFRLLVLFRFFSLENRFSNAFLIYLIYHPGPRMQSRIGISSDLNICKNPGADCCPGVGDRSQCI